MGNIPAEWRSLFKSFKDGDLVKVYYPDGSSQTGFFISKDLNYYPSLSIAGRKQDIFMDSIWDIALVKGGTND